TPTRWRVIRSAKNRPEKHMPYAILNMAYGILYLPRTSCPTALVDPDARSSGRRKPPNRALAHLRIGVVFGDSLQFVDGLAALVARDSTDDLFLERVAPGAVVQLNQRVEPLLGFDARKVRDGGSLNLDVRIFRGDLFKERDRAGAVVNRNGPQRPARQFAALRVGPHGVSQRRDALIHVDIAEPIDGAVFENERLAQVERFDSGEFRLGAARVGEQKYGDLSRVFTAFEFDPIAVAVDRSGEHP